MAAPVQTDVVGNADRLARLRATGLLDASPDPAFDRLTRLASRLLEAPLSTVTLIDADRQFYMSCLGMPEPLATLRQTPLEFSFCRHTVELGRPLIVSDTRGHPIVGQVPAIEQFGVLAYAGIPLLTDDGHALGTLCVMDLRVRDWTDVQVSSLTDLAAAVSTEIELRMDIAARRRVELELQAALGVRDDVLALVSHDLRNPVHTIRLSASFLAETLPAAEEAGVLKQQLGVIARSAERMERMIRDLLDAASLASGRLRMQCRRMDAAQLLDTACESFAPTAERKGLRFECGRPAGAGDVEADADRVLQVLANLVDNAVKFTPAGGTVRVALAITGDEAVFTVADTGAGIEREQQARVFEPFWQGRRGGRHGVGLGLGIARGIVETHGGRIAVESEPGIGSTFTVALPLVPPPA